MKIDVLAIGELLADIISEDYTPELGQATGFRMFQGGSPANVCANLQWMGARTVLVSCVGNDSIGRFLTGAIRKIGLDDSYITRSPTHPSSLVLVGRSRATPDFIAYRLADTQLPAVDETLVAAASIIHSSSFALSREPACNHILQAFEKAAAKGRQVSVDWNFSPLIWGDDDGQIVFRTVCSYHPLLKFSLDDAERFTGKSLSMEEALHFLDDVPALVTVLTCGKDGVWYKSQQQPQWAFQPAVPVESVKDTTGAGDAFWAGFLSAYLKNYCVSDCILEGLKIAAMKIQQVGPLYA